MSFLPAKICFVCLGNICRSPTAEGVMKHLAEAAESAHVTTDSAGTADYHVGEPPNAKSVAAATARGISLPGRARQFVPADFQRFTHIIAMDSSNLEDLLAMPGAETFDGVLCLLRDYDPDAPGEDVPDPYYGGEAGFEEVLDICERSCGGLLESLDA